jgi:hypothetical protein
MTDIEVRPAGAPRGEGVVTQLPNSPGIPDRSAVAAKLRGLDLTSVCWAPSSNGGHAWCGGPVSWRLEDGTWRSSCGRCNATGVASSGDRLALERRAAS